MKDEFLQVRLASQPTHPVLVTLRSPIFDRPNNFLEACGDNFPDAGPQIEFAWVDSPHSSCGLEACQFSPEITILYDAGNWSDYQLVQLHGVEDAVR